MRVVSDGHRASVCNSSGVWRTAVFRSVEMVCSRVSCPGYPHFGHVMSCSGFLLVLCVLYNEKDLTGSPHLCALCALSALCLRLRFPASQSGPPHTGHI